MIMNASRARPVAVNLPTVGTMPPSRDLVVYPVCTNSFALCWRACGDVVDMSADIMRHSVPADHSCLFASVAYLCQGISGEVELRTAGRKLREVCAQAVLADPDPASRAIMLGHDSVEAYVQWIRNETHWGGEPEVLMLAEHFETELVIVSCESLSVLRYAEGGKKGSA